MTISFTCDSCGKLLQCEDSKQGTVSKCPNCKGRVKIPMATRSLAESSPEQLSEGPKVIQPQVDDGDEYSLQDDSPGEGLTTTEFDATVEAKSAQSLSNTAAALSAHGTGGAVASYYKEAIIDRETRDAVEALAKDAEQYVVAIVISLLCSALGAVATCIWYSIRLSQWSRLAKANPSLVQELAPDHSLEGRFVGAKQKMITGIIGGGIAVGLHALALIYMVVSSG